MLNSCVLRPVFLSRLFPASLPIIPRLIDVYSSLFVDLVSAVTAASVPFYVQILIRSDRSPLTSCLQTLGPIRYHADKRGSSDSPSSRQRDTHLLDAATLVLFLLPIIPLG